MGGEEPCGRSLGHFFSHALHHSDSRLGIVARGIRVTEPDLVSLPLLILIEMVQDHLAQQARCLTGSRNNHTSDGAADAEQRVVDRTARNVTLSQMSEFVAENH